MIPKPPHLHSDGQQELRSQGYYTASKSRYRTIPTMKKLLQSATYGRTTLAILFLASCSGSAAYNPQYLSDIKNQNVAKVIRYITREMYRREPGHNNTDLAEDLARKIPHNCVTQEGAIACQSRNSYVNTASAAKLPRLELISLAIYPDGSSCSASIFIKNEGDAHAEGKISSIRISEKTGRRVYVMRSRSETLRKSGTVELFFKTCREEVGWHL